MARDYYLILGVDADATPDQIKSAYRRQAKRVHPDHSGEGCEPFLAIREAYEVLGDPGRRRAYDDELTRERNSARPEPLRRRSCPVEPLVPNQRSSAPRESMLEPSLPSLFEELVARAMGDWQAPVRPGSRARGAGELHLQVRLSRQEARHGGRIRLWLPMQGSCPSCGGWGTVGFFECPHCSGQGSVVDEYPVDVTFPAGLLDGSEASLSLRRPGMADLSLRLRFRIDEP